MTLAQLIQRKQQHREEQQQDQPLPSYLKPIDRDKGLGQLNVIEDHVMINLLLPCLTIPEICKLSQVSRTMLVLSEDDRLWKQFTLNRFLGEFWFEISWKYTYVHNMFLTQRMMQAQQNSAHNNNNDNNISIANTPPTPTAEKVVSLASLESAPPLIPENPFKGQTHGLYAKWSRSNFDMNQMVLPFSHLDRRNCMTLEQFIREYASIQKPVIITDAMNDWKAFKDFKSDTKEYKEFLLNEYGNVAFKTDAMWMSDWPHWSPTYKRYLEMDRQESVVEKRKKPSEELRALMDKQHQTIRMPLKMYMHYMQNNRDEEPIYLFDGKFGERAPGLLEDYKVPDYFQEDFFEQCLPQDKRPDFRWLVMGPKRSGSAWHMDPYMTSAWNALICGAKRWAFYPQGYLSTDLKELVDDALKDKEREIEEGYASDENDKSTVRAAPLPNYLPCSEPLEWLTEEYLDACDENFRPWECMQYPGEVLFVPSGWWHMVLNVDDTIAVTQNFVNTQNFAAVFPDIEKRDKNMAAALKQGLIEKNRQDLFWLLEQANASSQPMEVDE